MRPERRVSPSLYRFLVTAHLVVSVGWLGVVLAKLVLVYAAVTTTPAVAGALLTAVSVLNDVFAPLAIATIVTGIILSLGTKWGLLKHYWVVTKQVLTVGVIVSAISLDERFLRLFVAASPERELAAAAILESPSAPALLVSLPLIHLLMLGVATVVSVYKPWGRTWSGRRKAAPPRPMATASLVEAA